MGKPVKGNQDPVTGRLLPGNTWKAPAWRPGKSGHTARYTPGNLVTVCTNYIEQQVENEKPITWSGLAWFMGLSRRALDQYRKGNTGKDKPGIVATLEVMETAIESHLEQGMTDGTVPVQAALARLRTMDRDRWGDTVKHDVAVQQTIQIAITPTMPKLAQRFRDAGVTTDQYPDAIGSNDGDKQ